MTERIKTIRKNAKMSQAEFADALNVSLSIIQGWESGRRNPRQASLYMIADRFHVRRAWIENGTGAMYLSEPDPDDEAQMATAMIDDSKNPVIMLARAIVMTYNSLDIDGKRSAEKIATAIIKNLEDSINNV